MHVDAANKARLRAAVNYDGRSLDEISKITGISSTKLTLLEIDDWTLDAEEFQSLERFANDHSPLVGAEALINAMAAGEMCIVVDDEDRENEGDLIIPAKYADAAAINFMARYGRGLICLALDEGRASELKLEPMTAQNRSANETAFTISIEAREGISTGISAADRAKTIACAIDPEMGSSDIVSPGHVFPLIARSGGVLVRAGHTEAAVDLAELAGVGSSGVICEIMNEDGTMARMPDLFAFARRHSLRLGTIRDLIEYRRKTEKLVERAGDVEFNSEIDGRWRAIAYRNKLDGSSSVALVKGEISEHRETLVRMHGVSVFYDLLQRAGQRANSLARAMREIGKNGEGVVVILFPSGPKLVIEEIRANGTRLPKGAEFRDYGIGAQILADLGVRSMALLTNSHRNVVGIQGYGLEVTREVVF